MKLETTVFHSIMWRLARTPIISFIKIYKRFKYREQIKRRKDLVSQLSDMPILIEKANMLEQEGWCEITEILDAMLLKDLKDFTKKFDISAEYGDLLQDPTHAEKDHWIRLLDQEKIDGKLSTNHPCVRFALQNNILKTLSHRYRELPFLDDVIIALSTFKDREHNYSQLWHRDYDDTLTVKLFVYLTDVGSRRDGPFTFIPGPVSDKLGASLRSRILDTRIDKLVEDTDIFQLIAPKFSAFLVETSRCIHMGSRLDSGHYRLLYMASFISVPRLYPEPNQRFIATDKDSDVIKCVITPARCC